MITIESICEKLGFDPRIGPKNVPVNNHEDDSIPSPYASLTLEEFDFLRPYIEARSKK